MSENKNPKNDHKGNQEDADKKLNEFRINATQRRVNRQMAAPAPKGFEGQTITPEQLQNDEEYLQNTEQRLLEETKGKGLDITLDDRNVIIDEFEKKAENTIEQEDIDIEVTFEEQETLGNEETQNAEINEFIDQSPTPESNLNNEVENEQLELPLEDVNEFETSQLTPEFSVAAKNESSEKTEGEYFDTSDFDYSSDVNEGYESLSADFNDNSFDGPNGGGGERGVEPE